METFKLTKKDRRILRELNRNSRQSFSAIGKTVGLPKGVVAYRAKRMVAAGVITLFCVTTDRSKMDGLYIRLFLRLDQSRDRTEEIAAFLRTVPYVHWVAQLDGSFDLCIIFLVPGLQELEAACQNIYSRFGSTITERVISMATRLIYTPYNYLFDEQEHRVTDIRLGGPHTRLNITDIRLINLLKEDARKPLQDIAKTLGVSLPAARSRLKRLLENGIITGFTIRVDHTKIGFHHFHTFLSFTTLTPDIEQQLISFLCSQKETLHLIKGMGQWDLEVESVHTSHFALHNYLRNLKSAFPLHITHCDSVLIHHIFPINTVLYSVV